MVFQMEFDYSEYRPGLGGLFLLLQDVSAGHCGVMGLTSARLAEDGLMWVIARQYAQIERMPRPGERLIASTWHGGTRHMMFPRYCSVKAMDGELLLQGGALWAMASKCTRKMINPEDYGLALESEEIGNEPSIRTAVKKLPITGGCDFTVPPEYIDLNGHMNNTRYYDAAEHCLAGETAGLTPAEVTTTFISESRAGDTLHMQWGSSNGYWYIEGKNGKPVFRMGIQYK